MYRKDMDFGMLRNFDVAHTKAIGNGARMMANWLGWRSLCNSRFATMGPGHKKSGLEAPRGFGDAVQRSREPCNGQIATKSLSRKWGDLICLHLRRTCLHKSTLKSDSG